MQTTSPAISVPEVLLPNLRRVIAPNASPMTYWGTNTYLLGDEKGLCVIDPGPDDAHHLKALLHAIGSTRVSHIFVTHSHLDHSPLAKALSKATDAPVLGFGTFLAGRSPVMQRLSEAGLDSGGEGIDADFTPDLCVVDGDRVEGPEWALDVIHTPGHLGNHICLRSGDFIFTGDHVMAWSSSLVSPPDGDLTDYMASCEKLLNHKVSTYFPGHGPPVTNPSDRLIWLINHRLGREAEIKKALFDAPAGLSLEALTRKIYADTPPHLHPAAQRNVLAHLVDLTERSQVNFSLPLTNHTLFSIKDETCAEKPKSPLDGP